MTSETNERLARLETRVETLNKDLERIAESVEKLTGAVERFTAIVAGGKAIWWFLGLAVGAAMLAATFGDRITAFLRLLVK